MQREHKAPKSANKRTPIEWEIVLINDTGVSRENGPSQGSKESRDEEKRGAALQLPNGQFVARPVNLPYPLEITDEDISEDDGMVKQPTRETRDRNEPESSRTRSYFQPHSGVLRNADQRNDSSTSINCNRLNI